MRRRYWETKPHHSRLVENTRIREAVQGQDKSVYAIARDLGITRVRQGREVPDEVRLSRALGIAFSWSKGKKTRQRRMDYNLAISVLESIGVELDAL